MTDSPSADRAPLTPRGELIEALTEKEHDSWSRWMLYLFEKCERHPDGSATIPPWAVERWERQARTPYADLSEREKESDRDEVRLILPLIDADRAPAAPGSDLLTELVAALLMVEDACPCGARPESPATHPHAPGCPVERALHLADILRAARPAPPPDAGVMEAAWRSWDNLTDGGYPPRTHEDSFKAGWWAAARREGGRGMSTVDGATFWKAEAERLGGDNADLAERLRLATVALLDVVQGIHEAEHRGMSFKFAVHCPVGLCARYRDLLAPRAGGADAAQPAPQGQQGAR